MDMDLSNKVVVVADDDKDIRSIIASAVSILGCITIEAADGKETLSKIEETQPDLLILDWMMPAMTGLEVCQKVKQSESGKHVPVLILTARDTLQDKIEAFEDGADDYITKPFEFKELQARVKALLRMRELNLALYVKNKQLEQMQKQLVEKERQLAVTQLAGTAAHRIGQPLTAMLLNLHLLGEYKENPEDYHKIKTSIETDLKRAIAIIEELKVADANSNEEYYGDLTILKTEKT